MLKGVSTAVPAALRISTEYAVPSSVLRAVPSAHMDNAYASRLLDALGERSEPAVRAHDGVNSIEESAKQAG